MAWPGFFSFLLLTVGWGLLFLSLSQQDETNRNETKRSEAKIKRQARRARSQIGPSFDGGEDGGEDGGCVNWELAGLFYLLLTYLFLSGLAGSFWLLSSLAGLAAGKLSMTTAGSGSLTRRFYSTYSILGRGKTSL
ncbi:hypothetical protein B0T17DRAFT_230019 [Bombardia bombarda]|uniref:ATP synthase F0 subunit 8 n=1 Tax=Bombardia bombarda TaxID=252184 RepID=A0AA39XB98_9PEZI|nr:hypothetical protein B0T17DRAFT_230019 [Bombardia bombarda]